MPKRLCPAVTGVVRLTKRFVSRSGGVGWGAERLGDRGQSYDTFIVIYY